MIIVLEVGFIFFGDFLFYYFCVCFVHMYVYYVYAWYLRS